MSKYKSHLKLYSQLKQGEATMDLLSSYVAYSILQQQFYNNIQFYQCPASSLICFWALKNPGSS